MDWTQLLDPSFNPYQGLWDFLQPLATLDGLLALPSKVRDLVLQPQAGLYALLALGLVLVLLGRRGGSSRKPTDKQAAADAKLAKYRPRMGTPWHSWFWPMFGETWVIPLAPGWWPRWKWLEKPWANWFMHKVLFKIPGLAWRVILSVTPHIGIIGGTGAGKDAILQWVIEHVHDRAVVNIAMDKSAPTELSMRRAGGSIIKANGKTRWNLLPGDARFMSERVSRWWRMSENDTGSSRGDFRREAEAYGRATPSNERYIGYPYNQETDTPGGGLLGWITDREPRGADGKLGKLRHPFEGQKHWVNRLHDMALALGTTDGPGGIDLAEVIVKKQKIGFFWDTFRMVSTTSALGVATVLDVMRAAADMGDLREGDLSSLSPNVLIELEDIPGLRGAYVILNEGGSLEQRTAELDLFFKAARARDFRIWAAVQNPIHFGGVLTTNINQWVLFGVGDYDVCGWESKQVGKHEPPEAFSMGGGGLRPLEAFIRGNDRLQKVRIQPPDMRKPKVFPTPPDPGTRGVSDPGRVREREEENPGTESGYGEKGESEKGEAGPRWRVVEIPNAGAEDEWADAAEWDGEEEVEVEEEEVWERGPIALPGGIKVVPTFVQGDSEVRVRRRKIWDRLEGTWYENGDHLWPEDAGHNKGYGKTAYRGWNGMETHFLFWAWKVIEDYELRRSGDLQVFYARHPEVPRFEWPRTDDDIVIMRALKEWMAAQVHVKKLSIDHKCPGGAPNKRCSNYLHLWLATGPENSSWRHQRRNGVRPEDKVMV